MQLHNIKVHVYKWTWFISDSYASFWSIYRSSKDLRFWKYCTVYLMSDSTCSPCIIVNMEISSNHSVIMRLKYSLQVAADKLCKSHDIADFAWPFNNDDMFYLQLLLNRRWSMNDTWPLITVITRERWGFRLTLSCWNLTEVWLWSIWLMPLVCLLSLLTSK